MKNENNSGDGAATKRRFLVVGGFLGAGKTTLIGRMVRTLVEHGVTCGVVTNDQARGLVDTQLMEAAGTDAVSEVAGGCFCCRLEELVAMLVPGGPHDAAQVVIGEPVGSCTDLAATVLLPLERVYRIPFALSPLSVVVDARRALASLGGRRTPGDFSKDVGYIYRKQLEEAEIVVVNKSDLMADDDLADLKRRLGTEFPGKEVFVISAKSGEGVGAWMDRVMDGISAPEKLMDVDYPRYGAGEALLGWFNAEVAVGGAGAVPRDGDGWLLDLAQRISGELAAADMEVAHFKMSLKDDEGRLGVVSQTLGGAPSETSRVFGGSFRNAKLTVNLRAEGAPERLREMVEEALAQDAGGCRVTEAAAFRPGQPVPTAKVTAL